MFPIVWVVPKSIFCSHRLRVVLSRSSFEHAVFKAAIRASSRVPPLPLPSPTMESKLKDTLQFHD